MCKLHENEIELMIKGALLAVMEGNAVKKLSGLNAFDGGKILISGCLYMVEKDGYFSELKSRKISKKKIKNVNNGRLHKCKSECYSFVVIQPIN